MRHQAGLVLFRPGLEICRQASYIDPIMQHDSAIKFSLQNRAHGFALLLGLLLPCQGR